MTEDLLKLIEQKELQLYNAQQESKAWNRGKLKQSSNAKMSLILVNSMEKELADLRKRYNDKS